MTDLTKIEHARQSLAATLEPSRKGDAKAATKCLDAAQRRLRLGGREDLCHALADARADGICRPETRRQIRETIQKVDAELEPSVETPGFRPASDGGVDG